MMGFEARSQRIPATFATATTLSTAAIDVRGWNHVAIEVATFSGSLGVTSTCVYVHGAVVSNTTGITGATYRRIVDEGNYSAGAKLADWEVPTFEGNRTIICRPAARFDAIKIELKDATTAAFGCWINLHM